MPATRAIDLETLRRFDRPAPRYTSYPTAVELDESVGGEAYREHLAEIDRAEPEAPISLYVHVPFCRKRCRFCACHVIATPHEEVAEPYLDALEREIAAVAEALPRRRRVAQMHWGGGTPTFLSPAQIERLAGVLQSRFAFEPDAELAIEVDPRVTTPEQLETLARLGFNRLSAGVQDLSPEVQEAIGRGQTWKETEALVGHARRGRQGGGRPALRDRLRPLLRRLAGPAGRARGAGFVRDTGGALEGLPEGRRFVRNAAMAFDRYLAAKLAAGPNFSRTV